MGGIREWLERLGLGEFTEAFQAERIALDDVPELTDTDLKELGLPMGPRKAVLKAARELSGAVGGADAESEGAKPPARTREAERRQITVMFCDLAGSTALSERMDPEDLRLLLQAYQKACGEVIERYEGHVAQYLGDGLMTYFGWPAAHEDDAERAVRAGLEITDAVKAVDAPSPLRVRIGIATGPVVVGETGAGDASVPKLAVGETPNLAARVQGLAGLDEIVIAPSTLRLVAGAFTYDELGEHALKGIVEPVRVWRVTGLARTAGRFEAAHGAHLTPLVGREEEIGLLLRRWETAKDGEGQVVLLCGEPGIGKSRITEVLHERIADEPHNRLRYQCSPYHANSALYPVLDQIERAAGFARDDTAEAKLAKMEELLGQGSDTVTEVAPLFAAMLSIDPGTRYAPLALSPQKQKEETLQALADQLAGRSEKQPVLMVFEDAHWIDPTTHEWLDLVVPRIAGLRVLLVITVRPEYEPHWAGLGHLTPLTLTRLARKQAAAMVEKVTGGKALPAEVLDQIVAKTDGVPLFVEELTKTVLEAGFLKDAGDAYVLDGPLPPLAIPSTLRDSLMARLDRLAPVKETAQIAACIGREFSWALLAAVSPLADDELHEALGRLAESQLVFRKGVPPAATYAFKHALVQDAAYESLLKSRRQQLHARIAELLEAGSPGVAGSGPEIIAHHYTAAGLAEPAVPLWQGAGQQAAKRSANVEASVHFAKAIELIATLPRSPERMRTEIALHTALGVAQMATKGFAAPEVAETYRRARDLCEQIGERRCLFTVMWGLWLLDQSRSEFRVAQDLSDDLIMLASELRDPGLTLQAHHAAWATRILRGELPSALDHAERGGRIYRPGEHHAHALLYGGHDPGVCGLCIGSWCEWLLGYPDRARESSEKALILAEELKHPFSLAEAVAFGAGTRQFRGEASQADELAMRALSLSDDHGFAKSMWTVAAKAVAGWTLAHRGGAARAVGLVEDGIATWRSTGSTMFVPYYLGLLAETCALAGDVEACLARLDEALALAERTDEHWWDAELHRLKGVALLAVAHDNRAAAQSRFETAIGIAKAQGAKSFELRAATSLARLWRSQGKAREAHARLAPVYGWFEEGFDTADLKDAKALLDELR